MKKDKKKQEKCMCGENMCKCGKNMEESSLPSWEEFLEHKAKLNEAWPQWMARRKQQQSPQQMPAAQQTAGQHGEYQTDTISEILKRVRNDLNRREYIDLFSKYGVAPSEEGLKDLLVAYQRNPNAAVGKDLENVLGRTLANFTPAEAGSKPLQWLLGQGVSGQGAAARRATGTPAHTTRTTPMGTMPTGGDPRATMRRLSQSSQIPRRR